MPKQVFRWQARTAQGEWLDSTQAAREAAVAAGHAMKDEWGDIWLDVFTDIQVRNRWEAPMQRAPRSLAGPSLLTAKQEA